MGAGSSATRQDTLQYDKRSIADDEQLDFHLSNDSFNTKQVSKESVQDVPEAMVLKNVLTPEECGAILLHMFPDKRHPNKNHKSYPILFRDWEPDPEEAYRQIGVRIFTSSNQVAQALYERVAPLLPQTWTTYTPKENHREDWVIKGLHHRIRFVCYAKGQNFPPHRDDAWIQNDFCRSHLTFVMYLSKCGDAKSADFGGGQFAFLEPIPKTTQVKENAIILPEPGLVVAFPHRLMHESKTILKGFKFMIRSDVMYTLTAVDGKPVTPPPAPEQEQTPPGAGSANM